MIRKKLSLDRQRLAFHVLSRDNNFNLLRLLAAATVLYHHSYALSGTQTDEPIGKFLGIQLAGVAVDSFFIISGFLVTASLLRADNLKTYVLARVSRIFPALAVAAMFCAFVIGPLYTRLSLREYFSDPLVYSHVWRNSIAILGLKFKLPGVFEGNPYQGIVNGSLWTLRWELKMYLALGLIGFLHFKNPKFFSVRLFAWSVLLIAVLCVAADVFSIWLPGNIAANRGGFHLVAMFAVGATLFCFRNQVFLCGWMSLSIIALILLLPKQALIFVGAYDLGLGYCLIALAYLPGGGIRKFNAIGDYSYGIYIYAFPVQQALVASLGHLGVGELSMLAFPVTLVLAVMSWHWVERPMLRIMKNMKPSLPSVISTGRS